ncbi:MAG TPA: hypothetical protein VGG80_07505 [Acidobacteriaceae bacterium]|jgi:hypothetical protein
MSQKNQGNSQSMKQGADRGHSPATKVSGIEKVGSSNSGGIKFPVPSHHEHCDVRGPGGSMDTKG